MSKKTKLIYKGIPEDGGSVYWNPSLPHSAIILEELSSIIIVPLEEEVLMPHLRLSIQISKRETLNALKKIKDTGQIAFFFTPSDLYPDSQEEVLSEHVVGSIGVFGRVLNISYLPSNDVLIELELSYQGQLKKLTKRNPFLYGTADVLYPELIAPNKEEFEKENELEKVFESLKAFLSDKDKEQLLQMLNDTDPRTIKRLSFMIQNSPLHVDQRYSLLVELSLSQRRDFLITLLREEIENLKIRSEIGNKAMNEMGHRQREEFLRQQLQQIKNELGEGDDDDVAELRNKAAEKQWPASAQIKFEKELKKLSRFAPNSPDYAVQYTYIDTFLSLPWQKYDSADFSLQDVESVLNRDHYGMDNVKDRIIEQMAVMKLRKDSKSPIICLYGPPGVGKTSLGKSIAEATGRKYVRVALGGLHDEAEIRGHRRTYLGSMPGRIVHALEQVGSSDPVMVLDEIDKIGQDHRGDPEQALLEVLDPEQNCKFRDNYLDHEYDLSKVLFIATANSLQNLSSPLLDRMELIEIPGYVENEKIEIAKRHLIPRDLNELGFDKNEISFEDDAIAEVINSYTHESGVRKLEKRICEMLRKIARMKASNRIYPHIIDREKVIEILGKPAIDKEKCNGEDVIGEVTGLAWTQNGGEILTIESLVSPGKECKLTLTGNLGEIMKESATLALQYVRANSKSIGISEEALSFGVLHVHVPEGAVPKDGPSAGITIATSIVSTLSGRKVRPKIAMTGEITLRGKVIPVGGIREKVLAAKRSGIETIIISEKNRKDIEEIKPEYLEGLNFKYVNKVEEVLELSLL